jgi:diacylglycerol O-acyltransferase / wax synthase
MPPSPRERISGVDTAWLRMDQPTNLMMIVGVMMFEGRLELAAARKAIASRFLSFERFGLRAVQDAAGAWWEEPEAFDIGEHVVGASLPGRAGKRELERFVSELASTPLDPARPLWQFHVVDNFAGGGALVARIHHCYADGIALIQVMLSMTDTTAKASLRAPARAAAPASSGRAEADFWARLIAPVKGLVAEPGTAGQALQGLAGKGMEIASDVATLVLMGRDTPTRFKGALGTRKAVAWAESLPLDEVKAIGKALGCSINDVLLSMAAGALRDYLIAKGDDVDGLEIRAIVPVNLRPFEQGRDLGNHFGLVFLDVPVGIAHPLERLYEVRRRMLALKGSYQPVIALALLSAVGYGPRALQEQVTRMLGANASAVMTNVPGPQNALHFAGRRITGLEFWVPQSGGIGMGISILSYDGRIQFGVITDAGLVPDPARIVRAYGEEFDKLMWLTLMTPWLGDRPLGEGNAPPGRSAKPKLSGLSPNHPIPKRFRNL